MHDGYYDNLVRQQGYPDAYRLVVDELGKLRRAVNERTELLALLRWHLTGEGQPDLDGTRGRILLASMTE